MAEARARLRILTVDPDDPATVPEVASVPPAALVGSLPARVYRPAAAGVLPTVVYLHGGGWVLGDLDTHDVHARTLCRDPDAAVVNVGYRLAPEHRFPAAVDDAYTALNWVADHLDAFGGDASRPVIGGGSAGATLSAVCAQRARVDGLSLAARLLVYPSTDVSGASPSRTENGEGYFLTTEEVHWFFEQYLGVPARPPTPPASTPTRVSLTSTPPSSRTPSSPTRPSRARARSGTPTRTPARSPSPTSPSPRTRSTPHPGN